VNQPQFQIGDQLCPKTSKGQMMFPVFEVIAIRECNTEMCYICFMKQCIQGNLTPVQQIIPININQEGLAVFSLEGEFTSTIETSSTES
jgi:hypothetical protein